MSLQTNPQNNPPVKVRQGVGMTQTEQEGLKPLYVIIRDAQVLSPRKIV